LIGPPNIPILLHRRIWLDRGELPKVKRRSF